VVLTDAGLAALEAAWPTHVRGVRDGFAARLTREQARTLTAVFSAISAAAEAPATSPGK
jgi:hypothetical protein